MIISFGNNARLVPAEYETYPPTIIANNVAGNANISKYCENGIPKRRSVICHVVSLDSM